jgi:hypothetical protein
MPEQTRALVVSPKSAFILRLSAAEGRKKCFNFYGVAIEACRE